MSNKYWTVESPEEARIRRQDNVLGVIRVVFNLPIILALLFMVVIMSVIIFFLYISVFYVIYLLGGLTSPIAAVDRLHDALVVPLIDSIEEIIVG